MTTKRMAGLLCVAVLAAGCDSEESSTPTGAGGTNTGTSTGTNTGTSTGQGGQTATGTGGTGGVGGTAAGGATGGGSSTDGVDCCGEDVCMPPAEVCCLTVSGGTCTTQAVCELDIGAVTVFCDEKADCPGTQICAHGAHTVSCIEPPSTSQFCGSVADCPGYQCCPVQSSCPEIKRCQPSCN